MAEAQRPRGPVQLAQALGRLSPKSLELDGYGPMQRVRWLSCVSNLPAVQASARTLRVAIFVAEHANRADGLFWWGQARVAAELGLRREKVNLALRGLVEVGALVVVKDGQKRRGVRCFRLAWPASEAVDNRPRGVPPAAQEVCHQRHTSGFRGLDAESQAGCGFADD